LTKPKEDEKKHNNVNNTINVIVDQQVENSTFGWNVVKHKSYKPILIVAKKNQLIIKSSKSFEALTEFKDKEIANDYTVA